MENFKQFKDNNYDYEYNLGNTNIQEENEKKFDILLDGLLNVKKGLGPFCTFD